MQLSGAPPGVRVFILAGSVSILGTHKQGQGSDHAQT